MRANQLVHRRRVNQRARGRVDHAQLLADKPEIIFAERSAAGCRFLDTATRPALPDAVARRAADAHALPRLRAQEMPEAEVRRRDDPSEALGRLPTL